MCMWQCIFPKNGLTLALAQTLCCLAATSVNVSVDRRALVESMLMKIVPGILMARTYALWECRRWLLITFVVLGIVSLIVVEFECEY